MFKFSGDFRDYINIYMSQEDAQSLSSMLTAYWIEKLTEQETFTLVARSKGLWLRKLESGVIEIVNQYQEPTPAENAELKARCMAYLIENEPERLKSIGLSIQPLLKN